MDEKIIMPECAHAKGIVAIDYTDPVTGKPRERIKGENEILNTFFAQGWQDFMRSCDIEYTQKMIDGTMGKAPLARPATAPVV